MPDTRVKTLMADLERDIRVNLHRHPIRAEVRDGVLVLEGTVANIAAKRIAHHAAHRHGGKLPVLDLLRVETAEPEGAGQLRDEVVNLILEEPALKDCGLYLHDGGRLETLRAGRGGQDEPRIEIDTQDGTAILTGSVPSLTHRRLAEVLAWWAAGCEIVDNRLHVQPPERETDDELADAVRLVLEKDPLVHQDRLAIRVAEGMVTLTGTAASDEERYLAVQDVWYIPGVRDVADHIQVK